MGIEKHMKMPKKGQKTINAVVGLSQERFMKHLFGCAGNSNAFNICSTLFAAVLQQNLPNFVFYDSPTVGSPFSSLVGELHLLKLLWLYVEGNKGGSSKLGLPRWQPPPLPFFMLLRPDSKLSSSVKYVSSFQLTDFLQVGFHEIIFFGPFVLRIFFLETEDLQCVFSICHLPSAFLVNILVNVFNFYWYFLNLFLNSINCFKF